MKFSEICNILNCPTNVRVVKHDVITCEELEAAMILDSFQYDSCIELFEEWNDQQYEALMDYVEYLFDYDY
jgi:hypothetical protein